MSDNLLIWFLYTVVVGLIFAFCWLIVNYYSDSAEKYFLSTFAVASSYTVSLLCALLIPVDIFMAAKSAESDAGLLIVNSSKSLYYNLYSLVLFNAFFLIPLAFFYGEERAATLHLEIRYEGNFAKIFRAMKKTVISTLKLLSVQYNLFALKVYFVLLLSVLSICGLIFRPDNNMTLESGREAGWINQIFDVNHLGESAISFIFSILLCVGMTFWVINTSYGLTQLPMKLIRGQQSILETRMEIFNELSKIRERYKAVHQKYAKSHTKIPKEDQKILDYLKKRERTLSDRNMELDLEEDNKGLIQKVLKYLVPFRVLVGIIMLVISGGILGSLALSSIDRLMNSKCRWSCGFIIEHKQFMNPIDFILVYASKYFPLDYLIFSILVLHIFICSFYGIIKIGVKSRYLKGYAIRPGHTLPQALLVSGFIISFMIIALSAQMTTLSTQYTTFGSQKYGDDFCSLENVSKLATSCRMTNVSMFFSKISVSLPFFSTIYFIGNLIFLVLSGKSLLNALMKKKSDRFEGRDDYDGANDIEISEATNLLESNI